MASMWMNLCDRPEILDLGHLQLQVTSIFNFKLFLFPEASQMP